MTTPAPVPMLNSHISTAMLPASDLKIDPEVQRTIDPNWITTRVAKFRPDGLGVLVVSRRANGFLHIVDGQHRHALCLAAGYTEPITCQVYQGLSRAEEASMFRVHNDRRKVTPIDLFRIRVIEGELVATRLQKVLERYGWTARAAKSSGSFGAVSALEKVYTGWGQVPAANLGTCDAVISCITEAWGHTAHGSRGEIITGLGLLLTRYGSAVDLAKLVTEMASTAGGPLVLCGRAKALRDMNGGRVGDAMAAVLVNMVNKSRRVNRLPAWMEE